MMARRWVLRPLTVFMVLCLTACGPAHTSQPGSPVIEELSISSDSARLRALLHLPDSRGPHPALVLIHGSGRQTAEESAGDGVRRLLDLGFAVLAYDKRGAGASTGEYTGIGPLNSVRMFDWLAGDALAVVEALKARQDIDPARIGLVGWSQGGWIAPLAASRSGSVAFVISLSAPAVTVGEENAYSRLAGSDPGSRQGLSEEEIEREFAAFTGPHGYDPDAAIRALRVPSLWVLGERDRSLPVQRTVQNLDRIKLETGNPITVHVIPRADHSLSRSRDRRAGRLLARPAAVARWHRHHRRSIARASRDS